MDEPQYRGRLTSPGGLYPRVGQVAISLLLLVLAGSLGLGASTPDPEHDCSIWNVKKLSIGMRVERARSLFPGVTAGSPAHPEIKRYLGADDSSLQSLQVNAEGRVVSFIFRAAGKNTTYEDLLEDASMRWGTPSDGGWRDDACDVGIGASPTDGGGGIALHFYSLAWDNQLDEANKNPKANRDADTPEKP